ncbi:tetratricopeptide repeat protein [Sphingobacterium sp. CZ-UAM]|uniref:tetratricopeptide repeat protein n=1 Tax=Sphingobacterium sp. CZ-UAM TaxID=1933868 RepID=UPI000986536A|nr:tetratricopeptide repeat protein [Sphingobacterium sp. CZ-UAM]
MRILYPVALFILVHMLFFGCKQNPASLLLDKASRLADEKPAEALQFIDSISDPENSLNNDQYMRYLVTHTQIYHKNYLSIEDDTLIFKAIEYFRNKTTKHATLANFYGGTVLRSQKKYDLAMGYYKNAESYAKKTSDAETLGLITFNMGDLLSEQGQYDKAIVKYQKAANYYKEKPAKNAISYSSIGRMYLFKGNSDSAFHYFNKGIKIATDISNKALLRQLSESLAVTYEQTKNFKQAKKYLHFSFSLNNDSTKLPRYYLNFAILYDKMSLKDSVEYYAKRLKNELITVKDNYLHASILSFLINFEKANHNIYAAFDYQSDRMQTLTLIMKEREQQSVYKIEKQYNYEQAQKRYYKSISVRQRWLIILMGIVIAGITSFFFYWQKQKNNQLAIQGKMQTLNEMNNDLESRVQQHQVDLRRELLWRFDVTKKILKLNDEIAKKGRSSTESGLMLNQFNTIVYGQSSLDEQWEVLHQAFKQSRPTYSEKIRKNYPQISETEFRIAILTYADFSVKEIALILKQSPHTIQTRRTTLRKKLGIDNWGDIAEFIDRMRA